MEFRILKFAEWIAENHYRLSNVEKNIYYWTNEDEIKTTKQLLKDFETKPRTQNG